MKYYWICRLKLLLIIVIASAGSVVAQKIDSANQVFHFNHSAYNSLFYIFQNSSGQIYFITQHMKENYFDDENSEDDFQYFIHELQMDSIRPLGRFFMPKGRFAQIQLIEDKLHVLSNLPTKSTLSVYDEEFNFLSSVSIPIIEKTLGYSTFALLGKSDVVLLSNPKKVKRYEHSKRGYYLTRYSVKDRSIDTVFKQRNRALSLQVNSNETIQLNLSCPYYPGLETEHGKEDTLEEVYSKELELLSFRSIPKMHLFYKGEDRLRRGANDFVLIDSTLVFDDENRLIDRRLGISDFNGARSLQFLEFVSYYEKGNLKWIEPLQKGAWLIEDEILNREEILTRNSFFYSVYANDQTRLFEKRADRSLIEWYATPKITEAISDHVHGIIGVDNGFWVILSSSILNNIEETLELQKFNYDSTK